MNNIKLNVIDCKSALDRTILIGNGKSKKDGQVKEFLFHIWDNEYQVRLNYMVIDSGQAIEELLEVYNNL